MTQFYYEAIPGCSGTYTFTEGYIQSIDIGTNIQSILCTYEIQVPVDGHLDLQFLEYVHQGSCTKSYVAVNSDFVPSYYMSYTYTCRFTKKLRW